MNRARRKEKLIRRIELIFFTGVVVIGAAIGIYRFHQKKELEAQAEAYRSKMEAQKNQEESTRMFETNVVEYDGKTYRRNTYVKSTLFMGVDRNGTLVEATTAGSGGQADAIFLIAQDTERNQLKILQIPRDTMTEIILTDLSGNILGKSMHHLTLAYSYGDGRKKSCEYMTEAVSDLMAGFPIDHYMAASMAVLPVVNDAVDGVSVTIPYAGMERSDPAFIKGEEVILKGKQASTFLRYRDPDSHHSALFRMDQHAVYMEQFFRSLEQKSRTSPGIMETLYQETQDYLVTDLSKDACLKLGMDVLESGGITSADIYTVPGEGVSTAKYDEFYPDYDQLYRILLELFFREVS